MVKPQSEVETASPAEEIQARGDKDTLLSAPWFHDASDAAEWRAVAEERRRATEPPAVVASTPVPASRTGLWLAVGAAGAIAALALAGVGILALALSAVVLFG
jgi:hypothetical protein